jgi:hypothetical protein
METRGISRLKGTPPDQKLPMSIPLLLDIVKSLDFSTICRLPVMTVARVRLG